MEMTPANFHVRWMIRRDMPDVLVIESKNFEFPWSESEFTRCLRQRNCIGMVAEWDNKVTGYMLYELHEARLHILNFAVSHEYQRRGVGTRMIQRLFSKITAQRRNRILLEARETNLCAHLFFKKMGFKAINVLHDYYDDTTEDAYVFQYRPQETKQTSELSQAAS